MCMCGCVYVCYVSAVLCVLLITNVSARAVDWSLPLSLSSHFLETGDLTEPEVQLFGVAGQKMLGMPVSMPQCLASCLGTSIQTQVLQNKCTYTVSQSPDSDEVFGHYYYYLFFVFLMSCLVFL